MKILFHTIALNRADLLKQTIESIDTKHDWDLYIHVVSKDEDIIHYLSTNVAPTGFMFRNPEELPCDWSACSMVHYKDDKASFVDYEDKHHKINVFVKEYGYNIGVATCFNEALQKGYKNNNYDYVFFVNSDIKFHPGDIDKMIKLAEARPDKALITVCGTHGKHKEKWEGMNLSHGFAAAILMPGAFKEVGYFDENIFPAYIEDCDYFYRLWLSRKMGPVKGDRISDKDSPLVECLLSGKTHHEGSCVIYSDKKLFEANSRSHAQNNRYYLAKWGGLNDHEVNNKPFDEVDSLYIPEEVRSNPYPDYWDRSKEKERYYATR